MSIGFFIYEMKVNKKSHLLNCKCDTFVNITSPTQLQDGTTYDSINIIHHNYMKSTKNYSSNSENFSFIGYKKFLPIFWNPYST